VAAIASAVETNIFNNIYVSILCVHQHACRFAITSTEEFMFCNYVSY